MAPESVPNKRCFLVTDFVTCWSVLGCVFGCIYGHIWCREAIDYGKCEYVSFVDSSVFSKDFQGPQGTENRKLDENLTSWDMSFFGQRFGSPIFEF